MSRRVRGRTGVLVAGLAVVLGGLTGVYLLPEPATVLAAARPDPGSRVSTGSPAPGRTPSPAPSGASASAPSSASDAPSPSDAPSASASPTTGTGPVDESNLVPVSAFAEAGLEVTVYPQNGNVNPNSSVSECVSEREVGARTLADLTGRAPALQGTWDEPATTNTAEEIVAVAETPATAEVYAKRLAAAQTVCQDEEPGHFVYGPLRTEEMPAGSSARWLSRWKGVDNTTGRAPEDRPACGGVAVVANGTHFAVLEVYMCTDPAGMAVLARAAAEALA